MTWFQGSRRFALIAFTGFALFGCVTSGGETGDPTSVLSPSEQADGQATTVTADGMVKHEEECVPIAETDRVQPPSVEFGVARDLSTAGKATRPYSKYKCR